MCTALLGVGGSCGGCYGGFLKAKWTSGTAKKPCLILELEAQLVDKEREVLSLTQRGEQLEAQLLEKEREVLRLSQNCDQLRTHLAEREGEVLSLERRGGRLEAQLSEKEGETLGLVSKCVQLEAHVAERATHIQSLEQRGKQLEAQLEAQLAEAERKRLSLVLKSQEDQSNILRVKSEVSLQRARANRLETSMLSQQLIRSAELQAILQDWGNEVAILSARLKLAAEFEALCDRQSAQIVELEAQVAHAGEGEALMRGMSNSTISTAISSGGDSPLDSYGEAELNWITEEEEALRPPWQRKRRSSMLDGLEIGPTRLEDISAACLSNWIYSAKHQEGNATELVQLEAFPAVSFQAHCVLEDVRLGSLKVGTATAHLPGGQRVLYVIFKGTSYLLDIANWNIEHDYKETGDPASFIHKGAAGIVRNLLFLKVDTESGFIRRLQTAFNAGVRRMVLTGHSLGGLYAQAMLHAAFKERQADGIWHALPAGARQLLESMRCVTFGAPMCFGSDPNKDQSKGFLQFETFAHERAVNYMNECDPCPRAWSAVNPRDLMAKAAEAVKKGITVEKGKVTGRIAGRFVDTGIKTILGRSDFEQHIVGFSQDYRHLSRTRLLSKKNQPSFHWKNDFHLSHRGFDDHPATKYVERLLEASNPEDPTCQIYDDDEVGSNVTLEFLFY